MSAGTPFHIALDTELSEAVPYFNWDGPVTNAEVRRALKEGTEDERFFWTARILREARYDDVWRYLSLSRDVLPRWEKLRTKLGRKRRFWEYLIEGWRHDGLIR